MIGENEAFRHLYRGNTFKGIFLIVGDKPDWFDLKTKIFPCQVFIRNKIDLNHTIVVSLKTKQYT